jgi:hypothetical protein
MNPLNGENQQVSGLQGVQMVRVGQAVTLDGLLEHTSPATTRVGFRLHRLRRSRIHTGDGCLTALRG